MIHERSREALNAVGQAMVRAAGEGWQRISLRITGAANMIEAELSVERDGGAVDTGRGLDPDGTSACGDLRDGMSEEGKGTWYNAELAVDESGKIRARFDYDNPPFGGLIDDDDPDAEGDADPELLLADHRLYPRADELLPAWHPARGQTGS